MTPEAQRIAIVEVCGWKHNGLGPKDSLHHPTNCQCFSGPSCSLPDYLNDLNAMHEAVETLRNLPGSEWFDFQQILKEECGSTMNCIQATAAQRAEAFLRTLNLWKP